MIKPFKVNVSDDILKIINNKVRNYPWHEMPKDGGWSYGTNLDYMKEMLNETDGEFLYKRTMSYCSQSSGWSLNKDAADLFGLLN